MRLLEGLALLRQGEWDRAHRIAQDDPSQLGSWLHGIVHMAEPDEWNSRYWYRAAIARSPACRRWRPKWTSSRPRCARR